MLTYCLCNINYNPVKMRNWMFVIAFIILSTASCTKEKGCTDSNAINYNPQAIQDDGNCSYSIESGVSQNIKFELVPSKITRNTILNNAVNWKISGRTEVMSGATLTIQHGTKLYADAENKKSFLLVHQNAKIIADGTANSPILFTSSRTLSGNQEKGDWGGIVINGNAPVSSNYTNSEIDGGAYGGSSNFDNSGILKHVIIEYAGAKLAYGEEFNGLSLYGVGSGTQLEYIEVYKSADDGIEMFGGTVGLKNIVISDCDDDGIDWTEGWNGKGQFWHITTNTAKSNGIEAGTDGIGTNARPIISNVSIFNSSGTSGSRGIVFKEGVKAFFANSIIDGYSDAAVATFDASTTHEINNGDLTFTHNVLADNGVYFENIESWKNVNYFPYALKSYSGYELYPIQNDDSWFSTPTYFGSGSGNSDWMHGWTVGSM